MNTINIINKEFFRSTILQLVLFVFLGGSHLQSSAQCPPSLSVTSVTDATDAFTNDGEIVVTINAPFTGPFDFYLYDSLYNPIQGPFLGQASNTYTFSSLYSGNYKVFVSDQGCSFSPGSTSNLIALNSIAGGSISYSGDMSYCTGSGANLVAYSNGCSSPINFGNHFTLTDDLGLVIWDTITMLDSVSLPSLSGGDYTLSVTNLDNNCTSTDSFTITSNYLSSSYTWVNPSSAGANDGSITLTVSGGTPPLFLTYTGPSGSPITQPWVNGNPLSNLLQGTYYMTVTSSDNPACQSFDTINLIYNGCTAILNQPPASCDTAVTLSAQTTNVLLGSYSYTYELYFEGILIETLQSNSDSIGFLTQVSDSGQYSLTVINDSSGCVSNDALVLDIDPIVITLTSLIPESGFSSCDGQIDVSISGGTAPYGITWTNVSGNAPFPSSSTLPFAGSSSISNLCSDTYCIEVADDFINPSSSCTTSLCYEIAYFPCNVDLVVSDSILCSGGTGDLTASVIDDGSVGPNPFVNRYHYTLYLNGAPFGPVQSTNLSSLDYVNLFSGSYVVSVFDSSYLLPCFSDTILLEDPPVIGIYVTADSTSGPSVQDGVITIDSIVGGTPPYSYDWTDSLGNSFSTSSTSVTGLGYSNYMHSLNGAYTLTVTDDNGCTHDTVVYIHPKNAGANFTFDSIGITHATCYGVCDGSLYLIPFDVGNSSVPPFTYTWRDAATNTIIRVDSLGSPAYNSGSHAAILNNVCAGFYTLEVVDYYGNPIGNPLSPGTSGFVDFIVTQPDSFYVDLGPDILIDCGLDTVITAFPVGGNITNDSTLINSFVLDFNNPSQSYFADTLMTGQNYVLVVSGTVTDLFGNNYDPAYDYTALPALEVMLWNFDLNNTHRPVPNTYDPAHIYSFPFVGGSSGSGNPGIPNGMGVHTWNIDTTGFNGALTFDLWQIDTSVFVYDYTWTTLPPSFPNPIVSDEDTCYLNPGILNPTSPFTTDYIVKVTDAQACVTTDTINISWILDILNFDEINVADVLPCYGDPGGMISVSADSSTGFPAYTYDVLDASGTLINSVFTTDTTFGLFAGDYMLVLSDSIGCLSDTSTITVSQPDSLWACGVGNLNMPFLIDNFVMDFDTISGPFSHISPVSTLLGEEYLLVVSGTYGLEFFNANHKDPAFIIQTGVGTDDWSVNGSPIRPDVDVYSNTHEYSYSLTGDGNPMLFEFTDLTNVYGDNAGSLTFNLYKLGCANTDTAYTCSGDSTGYSTITVNGGVPFDPDGVANSGDEYYTYEWTDVAGNIWSTSETVSGLPAGDYTVTIGDANGCVGYERYLKVLESTDPLQIDSTEIFPVLCFGDSSGYMNIYFSGGFGPYLTTLVLNSPYVDTVYQSILDVDSVTIDSLTYGNYTFYVYDSVPNNLYGDYFCVQEFTFDIIQPQTPLSSTVNLLEHVSCWGDSTGKAKATASGGQSQSPYTYLWDNGETTQTADSLWADVNAIYPSPQWQGVTVTDGNGCTLRDSIQIEHANHQIQAYNTLDSSNTVQVIQDVQCFNACDAIATVSSVGGVLPHVYYWDIGNVGYFMPDTVDGICYGGHNIIIEDNVGCRYTVEFQISQPDELFADASWVDHIDCYGYDNGIAHGMATGGTPGYTFVWDSLSFFPNTSVIDPAFSGQMNDTAYNLTPGVHTVYVLDSRGCFASDTVTITEPDLLEIFIIDDSTVYSYCTGTSTAELYAQAYGGTEPYNYVWSDVLGQTTQHADNLLAGTYTVTVLDDRGCSASDTRNIDSVTNSMDATTSSTNVSCFGLQDGSAYVDNVIGAVPLPNGDYIYNWTYPNGVTVTQNNINFLYAGNYAVTITDSNNCTVTVYANIEEPDQLEYTLYNITEETCYGECDGSITVDVEGGTSPYYYDISETGSFPIPAASQVQLINDSLILGLCADDYEIYITDENNCVGTVLWGGVWEASIDSGVVVTIDSVVLDVWASCFNTSDGIAHIRNPNPLLTYTWENLAGNVVDTGSSSIILAPGIYNVVAHYADIANFGQIYPACDYVFTPFEVLGPDPIDPGENIINPDCYLDENGSITLSPSGGNSPYTWRWDTTSSTPTGPVNVNISNLSEDTYTVTIVDASGCEETFPFDIVEPDAISVVTNPFSVSCNGESDGSVEFDISGGTPNFIIDITSPISYTSPPIPPSFTTSPIFAAGVYQYTLEDANGCETDVMYFTIEEPASLISLLEPNAFYGNSVTGDTAYHISCNGESDGSLIVSLGGGTGNYTYDWTPSGQSSQLATNLSAGLHTVKVTDENGCEDIQNYELIEPEILEINGYSSGSLSVFPGAFDVSCKGLSDAACYADLVTGGVKGTTGYQHSWSAISGSLNGQISTLDSVVNLSVGEYQVIVTDANGCQNTQNFILTEPAEEFISTIHLVGYAGPATANVNPSFQDATVSLSNIQHTFYWPDNTVTNPSNLPTSIGQLFDTPYSFDVIGPNEVRIEVQNMHSGCIDDTTFIIEVQGIPDVNNVFSPNADGVNDYFDFGEYGVASITVDIYNRWGQLVFTWETNDDNWDGTGLNGEALPEGVYYYVLKASGEDGHAYDKRGSVTLFR